MEQFDALTKSIGFAAVNHSGEMVSLLSRNGVIVPTETLNTKMLVGLIVNAMAESPSFAKDFSAWAAQKASAMSSFIGPTLPDGSTTSGGGSGEGSGWLGNALKAAGQLGSAGLTYVQGRQNLAAANALSAAEQAKLEAARLESETADKSFAGKLALSQASTTKVVVFGLLGLAAIGGAIWYFTRKK
jgi:hypothetical protein